MIGWLKGRVVHREPMELILDVAGVGYRVAVPLHLAKDSALGAETEVFVYTHMNDGQIRLYGFATSAEKAAFERLLKIHGVGPRAALKILSHLAPEDLARVVRQRDTRRLKSIPGIGGKTSDRIIMELTRWAEESGLGRDPAPATGPSPADDLRVKETLMALEVLGYKKSEMEATVRKTCAAHPDADVETIVQMILQKRGASL